jgi:hypothetical protein
MAMIRATGSNCHVQFGADRSAVFPKVCDRAHGFIAEAAQQ